MRNGTTFDQHPMVEAVRALGPTIDELGGAIDANRRLPDELVDALTEIQVFQMFLPRRYGGPEVHPLTGFAVCEELARHDGSVGWCAQVAAATTVFLAWLDPDAVADMVSGSASPVHVAGSARPLGTGIEVEGGYRVSGQWNYASGVRHANWFLATSVVPHSTGGRRNRSMLVPVADGTIVDNWDVMGMRGTGSDDFVLDDVFVPERQVGAGRWIRSHPEPLYDPRLNMVAAWAPTAGVGIGLAQGAIDALLEIADLTSTGSTTPLRQREPIWEAVARAETITSSARAFVIETLVGAWDALPVGGSTLEREVARAQLAITHSLNEAVRVADLLFHAAGTNALSTQHRLERVLRDAHTAVQHVAGQSVHQRMAGRVLLGLGPGTLDLSREGPSTPKS